MKVKTHWGNIDVGPVADHVEDVEKELVGKLPRACFHEALSGGVRVLKTLQDADKAVDEIWKEIQDGKCEFHDRSGKRLHAIGFDTETRPQFKPGRPQNNLALIQLATRSRAYLFQLHVIAPKHPPKLPSKLVEMLQSPKVLKIGVGCSNDTRALQTLHPTFDDKKSFLNLESLLSVKFCKLRRLGLRNSTASILKLQLSKAEQMRNWEMRSLTDKMIAYAANDAIVSIKLLEAVFSDRYDGKITQIKEETVIHLECTHCSLTFHSRVAMDNHFVSAAHLRAIDSQVKGSAKRKHSVDLSDKEERKNQSLEYCCEMCKDAGKSRKFGSEESLQNHCYAAHSNTDALKRSMDEFHKTHPTAIEQKKNFPSIKCAHCSRLFYTDEAMEKHKLQVHETVSESDGFVPSDCSICKSKGLKSKTFRSRSALLSHQHATHTSSASDPNGVKSLQPESSVENFVCPVCQSEPRPSGEVIKHIIDQHNCEENSKRVCPVCKHDNKRTGRGRKRLKSFDKTESLEGHILHKHLFESQDRSSAADLKRSRGHQSNPQSEQRKRNKR